MAYKPNDPTRCGQAPNGGAARSHGHGVLAQAARLAAKPDAGQPMAQGSHHGGAVGPRPAA
jgi:hypothetical protein